MEHLYIGFHVYIFVGFTEFRWQKRFHDHIIRDEESLHRIRKYIINNPAKWELDRINPQNIK